MFSETYNNSTLFQLALGIQSPWQVEKVVFSADKERLDIYIKHIRGSKFECPHCQNKAGVYDTNQRTWRHLNFFQYEAYLHCPVPRIKCGECNKTSSIPVPWARAGSGFTLLFEAFVMELTKQMALSTTGGIVGEHDTRLMRIIKHYVEIGRNRLDMSNVTCIGVDETSSKKGHNYITIVADLKADRILFATSGKDHTTLERFVTDLKSHQGKPENIVAASIDLSPAYQKGMKENFPHTEITFDHYHVVALVNKALDEVRRQEAKQESVLKHSRYWWLKNPTNLKTNQAKKLKPLSRMNLKTARAYRIKLALQEIYRLKNSSQAELALKKWYYWATHSRIPQIVKVAKTIKAHWQGILNYFKDGFSSGMVECFNGIIQTLKRRARGYRNIPNFITMVYLVKGELDFGLPVVTKLTHSR